MLKGFKTYHKMFVGSDERNVSELIFDVHAQGFDTVPERIGRGDSWDIGQEALEYAFVHRLINVVLFVRALLMVHLLLRVMISSLILWL